MSPLITNVCHPLLLFVGQRVSVLLSYNSHELCFPFDSTSSLPSFDSRDKLDSVFHSKFFCMNKKKLFSLHSLHRSSTRRNFITLVLSFFLFSFFLLPVLTLFSSFISNISFCLYLSSIGIPLFFTRLLSCDGILLP